MYFILSCFILIGLLTNNPIKSAEAPNNKRNIAEELAGDGIPLINQAKKICFENSSNESYDLPESFQQTMTPQVASIHVLPPDIIHSITLFLPLPAALRFEQTCKHIILILMHAPHYRALIEGFENPESSGIRSNTARGKFLELREESHDYSLRFAQLWMNYFPLTFKNQRLPLGFYWEAYIDLNNSRVRSALEKLFNKILKSHRKSGLSQEARQQAQLGAILTSIFTDDVKCSKLRALFESRQTLPTIRSQASAYHHFLIFNNETFFSPVPTEADVHARQDFKKLQQDDNLPPINKVDMKYLSANFDYHGRGIEASNYPSARSGFQATVEDPYAIPPRKASALLKIALIDSKIQGIVAQNFERLLTSYIHVILNPSALPLDKEFAKFCIKRVEFALLSASQSNLAMTAAYCSDEVYKYNWTGGKDINRAQLLLADHIRTSQSTHDQYVHARHIYRNNIESPHTSLESISFAQYGLAEMNRRGQGLNSPDHIQARIGYELVINNSQTQPNIRALARQALIDMDYLRQGIREDHARAQGSTVLPRDERPTIAARIKNSEVVKSEGRSNPER